MRQLSRKLGLSRKQDEFFHSNAFINVADGAVRSGKTHSSILRFFMHSKIAPPGDMMILGRTERTVERNVISPMRDMLGKRVNYLRGVGQLRIGDRLVHVVGASDERAQEKIRGVTLAGAYCNELTLYPQSAFNELIARCSVEGAKLFADTNPDSPFHWLYKEFLGRNLDARRLKRVRFNLSDNPSLPEDYVENLKALYTGLWYKRMVLGEWVVAEGAVYEMLDTAPGGPHVVTSLPKFERVVVGVDYGTSNPTVYLAAGKSGRTWTVFSEHRHDGRTKGQKTDAEHSRDFTRWVSGLGYTPTSVEVDPSAASFKAQLKKDGVQRVRDADHNVIDGIRVVSTALSNETLKIHESCQELLSEMSTYSWDPKWQKKGEDKPLKENDHGPDALRYLSMRVLNRPALSVVNKPVGF